MKKNIVLLGSTGSIGTQSLDVCRSNGYRIQALTAGSNIALLENQAREFMPETVAVADASKYRALKTALADLDIRVTAGEEAVCEAAALAGADTVINAIVGIAGLRPTLSAIRAGKTIALSNKEALIAGGKLVMDSVQRYGAAILPVDSEHSAIWQCLQAGEREDVAGVILTASGGPFRGKKRADLKGVTVEEALRHPNWNMGAKITIDSATLMNKGLEFIEAMWLFGLLPSQIEIVVHHQSIVHSAVEFQDGSVIAQLGVPDMRCAIQYALTYPRHSPLPGKRLSLTDIGTLTFQKPDLDTFACLFACIRAAHMGGFAPCIANGANEVAVNLFRRGKIGFLQIGELVSSAVEAVRPSDTYDLSSIEAADRLAREYVLSKVNVPLSVLRQTGEDRVEFA